MNCSLSGRSTGTYGQFVRSFAYRRFYLFAESRLQCGSRYGCDNAGFMAAHFCDEAIHPEYNDFGEEWFDYWEDGYKLIRDLNSLLVTIPTLTSITEQQKNEINAETHF